MQIFVHGHDVMKFSGCLIKIGFVIYGDIDL